MNEGFYSVAYTGLSGYGFGVVVLAAGTVVGADAAGGTYDGTYALNTLTGMIDLDVTISAPAGMPLVPLPAPLKLPIKTTLPRDLGAQHPVLVETLMGPVNVIFKRIRDFPLPNSRA